MCHPINVFRLKSYSHVMDQLRDLVGVRSIWDVSLQRLPTVRGLAVAGQLDRLECLLASAKAWAGKSGLLEAAEALTAKESELAALRGELAVLQVTSADIVVLDEDWGKSGRGVKIMAWIAVNGASAEQVMTRFQLAKSTAQRYIRRARKSRLSLAA